MTCTSHLLQNQNKVIKMKERNLSTTERNRVVQFLLQNLKNGKPLRGKFKEAAAIFNIHRRTVGRYWAEAKKQESRGQAMQITSKKPCSTKKLRCEIDLQLITSIPMHKRCTIRSLAQSINCSKSTVGRWVLKGLIRAHTSAIKPDLTAPNKLLRLEFSLQAVQVSNGMMNSIIFKGMHNTIHIDEKWFFITRGTHRYYLTPQEADPHRSCKNKKYITKVMFMCAVCRPMYNEDGSLLFDGKIGIFPFIEKVPAQRSSKNRAAGTLETKPIESVNKIAIKDCVINKVAEFTVSCMHCNTPIVRMPLCND